MKLTMLLMTVACIQVSASTLAQKITLKEKDVPLAKALNDVKKQSGFAIFYDNTLVSQAGNISVELNNVSVDDAMSAILKDKGFTYEIIDKTIVIKEKQPTVLDKIKSALNSDKIDLHGRIVNENGEPLSGATITVKGTNQSTSTDANGYFYLSDVNQDATIAITYIGYTKQELKAAKDLGTVKLAVTSNALDQVQVVAYGQTTQRLNTGDVTTVSSSVIEKAPVENVLSAIEGRVPGLLITQGSGMPNSPYSVQIRGQNSMKNGNDPFYVIDGVPYTSELINGSTLNPATGAGYPAPGNPLNFINPSDIESISILKDADATAIYGSRAANGAILITTKKGKAGKLKLDINASEGIAQAPLAAQWLNTPQYLAMRREAFKNDGVQPNPNSAPDLLAWDTTRYTDWEKLLIGGTASYSNISGNISGGSNTVQYLFGATYNNQSTVFPSTNSDQKLAFHFNLNGASENQKFKFTLTASYSVDDSNLPEQDLTIYLNTPPDSPPIYNSDGTLNWANSTFFNPMAYTLYRYNATTNNLVTNALLSYTLTKGLVVKSSFGYTNLQSNESSLFPIAAQNPAYQPTGSSSFSNNNIHSWIAEPQLSYSLLVGKSHFDFLIGSTFEGNITNGEEQSGSGYTTDALLGSIMAAPTVHVSSLTDITYKYDAIFGRVNYNYDDKYIANLNWRRDGSSRFGPDNEFHNFGSIGGAWIFTKENFFTLSNVLSFGKLRASYGTTGNDQIGDYRFYNSFKSASYSYQGTNGLTPTGIYNPYLEWESTKKLEGGLDLGFFNDRILLDVNYYYDRSSNQLLTSPLPLITGFATIPTNLPATVQNKGWEFALSTRNIDSKYFKWKTSFDFTANQNKLVAFPGLSSNATYKNIYTIGQPISYVKLYQSLGVNPQTGIYQFEGSNGQPTYSPSALTDKTVFIDLAPKFYGGFQNSFSYRAWQLDVFFQFKKQMGQNPLFSAFLPPGGQANSLTGVLNRWQAPGDNSRIEQFTQNFGGSAFVAYSDAATSQLGFVDASYIRLSNLSLSYQLSGAWMNKMNLQRLQIFIHAQNLFTITGYKGLDPETLNTTALPTLKIITAGVQISM
jgi:TonB-linked SusC/RagA family outer membrane protein